MKRIILCMALVAGVSALQAQVRIGGRTINVKKVEDTARDVASAVSLSDEDVAALCRETVEWMDANNPIADEASEYGRRLARLTANLREANGIALNFKVYDVSDVNAFACGDGSVRIFSALMDLMDDDELVAVIGHEVGHVAGTDVKDALRTAYVTSAAINAAGAASRTVGALSETQLKDLAQAFVDAQFSQKQEYAADDYGFDTCIANGFSPYGMARALDKLVELSQSSRASTVQKMFASHPDSEKRARRMHEKADKMK
ncbi:MAG: M48 family metalloprotease [Tannerella sp.]|jgi:putative metalloprotease|nr:M48 family metalloprotease [Tannerella sp.]